MILNVETKRWCKIKSQFSKLLQGLEIGEMNYGNKRSKRKFKDNINKKDKNITYLKLISLKKKNNNPTHSSFNEYMMSALNLKKTDFQLFIVIISKLSK